MLLWWTLVQLFFPGLGKMSMCIASKGLTYSECGMSLKYANTICYYENCRYLLKLGVQYYVCIVLTAWRRKKTILKMDYTNVCLYYLFRQLL